MDWISDPEIWVGFLTLVALEIVLGIDNLVFLSILSGKLPGDQQSRARRIGLALALIMRIVLLLTLSWIIGLTAPLFTLVGHEISGRDLILIAGGLFLLAKSTYEIHDRLEGETGHASAAVRASFVSVIVQIGILDIVFSLDSVITAVGMVDHVGVMIVAVIAAVAVMMVSSNRIARFVDQHPTIKMLALSFLLLIGLTLVLDGLEIHVPKGYIYFAMAFSLGVELLNLRVRRKGAPVELHERYSR
jgi:predicted tellurium resistance membrane protein TerC